LEIELPDGTVLDAPDGADIKAVVAGYTRSKEGDTLNAMPGVDKFGVGLARPFIRTALGIKQLSGSPTNLDVDEQGGLIGTDSGEPALSDDDLAVLRHLSQVKGPAASAGDITGNVAMLAAPGGVVGAVGSALPKTMAMRGLTIAGGDAAANAATAALAVPEEGQTRGGNAALAAVGSGIGSAAGGLVKGGVSSPAYQSFLNLADRLTGGLDKIFPSGYRNMFGAYEAFHGGSLTPVIAANTPKALNYLVRTDPVKNFATGETAAQNYLKSNFPAAIDYLSQVGASAADGAND
jgi:hypothetical protein